MISRSERMVIIHLFARELNILKLNKVRKVKEKSIYIVTITKARSKAQNMSTISNRRYSLSSSKLIRHLCDY